MGAPGGEREDSQRPPARRRPLRPDAGVRARSQGRRSALRHLHQGHRSPGQRFRVRRAGSRSRHVQGLGDGVFERAGRGDRGAIGPETARRAGAAGGIQAAAGRLFVPCPRRPFRPGDSALDRGRRSADRADSGEGRGAAGGAVRFRTGGNGRVTLSGLSLVSPRHRRPRARRPQPGPRRADARPGDPWRACCRACHAHRAQPGSLSPRQGPRRAAA